MTRKDPSREEFRFHGPGNPWPCIVNKEGRWGGGFWDIDIYSLGTGSSPTNTYSMVATISPNSCTLQLLPAWAGFEPLPRDEKLHISNYESPGILHPPQNSHFNPGHLNYSSQSLPGTILLECIQERQIIV
ncbi:hypothetical protein KIL84_015082 [Mauremys mutica]|uniref:Uncharacterized protein n=1 Tax=Mauremys mutica TaxID=74926 RepID=A0A9D3XQV8_9SAUR|nr:hypothetical protein KIL84_015082 [Mauremys mutica]